MSTMDKTAKADVVPWNLLAPSSMVHPDLVEGGAASLALFSCFGFLEHDAVGCTFSCFCAS